ncbi:hypothetical protein K438DRAFT_2059013 [Mycena galopus ATCC 62051]|nr:hypothetical protein K438DRAFT_2059013 [Mycena galopus ATCC 62051]
MARFSALFCAVFVAATSAAAAAVQERDSALITFFTDINYLGQESTYSGTVPTGCIPLSPPFVSSVSSVQIANGIRCTLWNESQCGLAAGKSITLTGNVPNLVSLEFNDLPRTISTLRSVVSFALERFSILFMTGVDRHKATSAFWTPAS